MILLTGGSGFVGRALIRRLLASGQDLRLLLDPGVSHLGFPKSTRLEVALCSLSDTRGLQSSLADVDAIFHLAPVQEDFSGQNLYYEYDPLLSANLVRAAEEVGVKSFVAMSLIGADRGSAFALMKARGIEEQILRQSSLPYVIFRSAVVYGAEDRFSHNLARYVRKNPGLVLLPGGGEWLLQPLWVEDLAVCLETCLTMPHLLGQVLELGGAEQLSLANVVALLATELGRKRQSYAVSPALFTPILQFVQGMKADFPLTPQWTDYFSENRACDLDSLSRYFGIIPARFKNKISYLKE